MSTKDSQVRATAYRYARNFEEKKALRNRVADLVVEIFDIPADSSANPACPQLSDAKLFRQGLELFQISDFDDLVRERNIDDRCGYGLCSRPNMKVPGGHQTVWNGKGGKGFSLVPKAELEKWCSKECGDRAMFVRAQLSKEPAWNRETSTNSVRLLDEVQQAREKSNREAAEVSGLTGSLKAIALNGDGRSLTKDELADRLQELALERGELKVEETGNKVILKEKAATAVPKPPISDGDEDVIEGHRPRNVHFAEHDDCSSDESMSEAANGVHDDPDV